MSTAPFFLIRPELVLRMTEKRTAPGTETTDLTLRCHESQTGTANMVRMRLGSRP